MKIINVKTMFRHSDDGNTVKEYEPGEHEVSDRCAHVAVESLKVAELVGGDQKEPTKSAPKKTPPKTK
jgi:hypothetical protein